MYYDVPFALSAVGMSRLKITDKKRFTVLEYGPMFVFYTLFGYPAVVCDRTRDPCCRLLFVVFVFRKYIFNVSDLNIHRIGGGHFSRRSQIQNRRLSLAPSPTSRQNAAKSKISFSSKSLKKFECSLLVTLRTHPLALFQTFKTFSCKYPKIKITNFYAKFEFSKLPGNHI